MTRMKTKISSSMRAGFNDHLWLVRFELRGESNSLDGAMYNAARFAASWLKKHKQELNGTLLLRDVRIDMAAWNDDNRPTPIYSFDFHCRRPEHFDPRYNEDDQSK